ncbi:hypothetical protein OF83DRAFT_869655 [Amylostereum chailletii]|nr:hypothetical protein OF83DRAFT_869655 [Amylostereum chailletii]
MFILFSSLLVALRLALASLPPRSSCPSPPSRLVLPRAPTLETFPGSPSQKKAVHNTAPCLGFFSSLSPRRLPTYLLDRSRRMRNLPTYLAKVAVHAYTSPSTPLVLDFPPPQRTSGRCNCGIFDSSFHPSFDRSSHSARPPGSYPPSLGGSL